MAPTDSNKTMVGNHGPPEDDSAVAPIGTATPKSIGGYRLEELIGTGGMSHVFRATSADGAPPVAVKVLDARFSSDPEMQQRFRREVSAIQSLRSDHIVPLLAHGDDHGVPYLAMKLINGVTFGELIQHLRQMLTATGDQLDTIATSDESSLADTSFNANAAVCYDAIRTRRSIFEDLSEMIAVAADAIEAAHQQGIVHRDIKPSNLMLDNEGTVWLTDFGLASIEEAQTVVTKSGEMIGTPHYMSPEQATADRKSVDHRTDIYSLGATLYEILTLRRPHEGERFRVLMEISTGKLTAPTKICPELPRPLEAIILKAMQYAPQDRYQTAAEMAEDLRRCVRGKSITAKPPSFADRAVRWTVRNPRLASGAVLGMAGIVLLIMSVQYVGSKRLEDVNTRLERSNLATIEKNRELNQSRARIRRHLYVADVAAAYRAYAERHMGSVDQLLSRHIPEIGPDARQDDVDLRGYEWRLLRQLCTPPAVRLLGQHSHAAREAALMPDHESLISVDDAGNVVLRDLKSGGVLKEHPVGGRLDAISVSPDGSHFVTGENVDEGINRAAIRSLDSGKIIHGLAGHEHSIESIAHSSDGKLIAVASRYLDVALHESNGKLLAKRSTKSRNESIAFAPDGKELYAAVRKEDRAQYLQAYSIPDLKPTKACRFDFSSNVFAFADDGRRFVVAGTENISLCRWPSGETLFSQAGVRGRIRCVAINPSGTRIYAGCDNGTLYVWELTKIGSSANSQDPPIPLVIPTGPSMITNISLTEKEEAVVTTESGAIQLWQTTNELEIPMELERAAESVASTNSHARQIYIRHDDGSISKLDLETDEIHALAHVTPDRHVHLALSPDGTTLVASAPNSLHVISSEDGRVLDTIETGVRDDPTDGLAFSSDGSQIIHLLDDRFQVYGSKRGDWDLIRQVELNDDGVRGIIVAPNDGRILVNISAMSEIQVFDGKSHKLIDRIPCHFGNFSSLQFSDDGTLLCLGYGDGTVEVVDAASFEVRNRLQGHRTSVNHSILTNDNRTLITGSYEQLRFWDLPSDNELINRELSERELSGRELGVLAVPDAIQYLHLNPKNDRLYTFLSNLPVHVWPTSTDPSIGQLQDSP